VDHWVQAASLLHSNGDAMDVAVKKGASWASGAGRATRSTTAGWAEGPVRLAGQTTRPTGSLVRVGWKLVESDWDTAMERIVRRSKELLTERSC
jgi:hypothetical protein